MLSLFILTLFALGMGRYPISIVKLGSLLWHHALNRDMGVNDPSEFVIFRLRMPRIVVAMLVGMALSGAGASYQCIFRNPMVDPSLLGVTSGAAFGASLAILLSMSIVLIQVWAFICGLAAVLATMLIAKAVRKMGDRSMTLILCGIVTGTLFTAFLSLVKYAADPNSKLPAITYWLMGSLASVSPAEVNIVALCILAGILPLFFLRWQINVLSAGEEEAQSMGILTGRIRGIIIASSTLMTASVVSVSGMIGWVGLVVPHLARMLVGPNFTILFPTSLLLGALFMLTVDTLARLVFPIEIPIGILTAIVGAPFFVFLLFRGKRGWA
ncbi:MAG: Fe3+-siderophore ABC transporter permease [Elusimicrobia bacterium RIFOXYB2_FULL_49_7]|nr:MAG: Fe3+-siderophore ABC transporter permease [Elusimicrobia bacterium RIFOXYB2_FULL_49_7]